MANHPELVDIYSRVFGAFAVNWTAEVQWIDLRRPFFSALAARIYFEIVGEDIPDIGDLEGQGQFWKDHFNSNPQDTVQNFINDVDALELEGMCILSKYPEKHYLYVFIFVLCVYTM